MYSTINSSDFLPLQLLDSPGSGQNPYLQSDIIPKSPLKGDEMTMANTAELINKILETMILSNDDIINSTESDFLGEEFRLLHTPSNGRIQLPKKKRNFWSESDIIELIENVYYTVLKLREENPGWGTVVRWDTITHSTHKMVHAQRKYYHIKKNAQNYDLIFNQLAQRGIFKLSLVDVLGFTITDCKSPHLEESSQKITFLRKSERWTIEETINLIIQLYKQATYMPNTEKKVFNFTSISIPNRTEKKIIQKYYDLKRQAISPTLLMHLAKYKITENELNLLYLKGD